MAQVGTVHEFCRKEKIPYRGPFRKHQLLRQTPVKRLVQFPKNLEVSSISVRGASCRMEGGPGWTTTRRACAVSSPSGPRLRRASSVVLDPHPRCGGPLDRVTVWVRSNVLDPYTELFYCSVNTTPPLLLSTCKPC